MRKETLKEVLESRKSELLQKKKQLKNKKMNYFVKNIRKFINNSIERKANIILRSFKKKNRKGKVSIMGMCFLQLDKVKKFVYPVRKKSIHPNLTNAVVIFAEQIYFPITYQSIMISVQARKRCKSP